MSEFPSAWPRRTLGDLGRYINGMALKPNDWTPDGLPIIRIQNLTDPSKPFNRFAGEVSPRYLVRNGDLLISWSASLGSFIWNRGDAILNQHIFRVEINEALVEKEFLHFLMLHILDEMQEHTHGSTMKHITKGKFDALEVGVPPLAEQRRLTAVLGDCLGRIEEMHVLRTAAVREAGGLLPSSLAAVFAEIGGSQDVVPIGEMLLDTRYGTSQKCDAGVDATPVLRIPNVSDGRVTFDRLKYCRLDPGELRRLTLQSGDLLVVRTNGSPDLVGRCAVFESAQRPCAFASYLIRMRVDPRKADPRFIAFFLASTPGRDAIAAIRRTSAGQFNVNSENLRAIRMPLPALAEQRRIAERLKEQQVIARAIVAEQSARLSESAQLRIAVLRKAFAGEL